MNYFDFAATNARQQASESQGGLSPIRSETLSASVDKLPVAAQRLLDAWDNKHPLAWQPENNSELLEGLRSALLPKANATKGKQK